MLRRRRPGFTLVEMLVVIAIIGLVAALLLPAVQASREAGRRLQCKNNLKQLALAVSNYEAAHSVMPPAGMIEQADLGAGLFGVDCRGGKMLSWLVAVLPFIEEQSLYHRFDTKRSALDQPNEPQETHLEVLLCPSDDAGSRWFVHPSLTAGKRFAKGNYAAFVSPYHVELQLNYPGALVARSDHARRRFIDGASKTLMLAEILTRASETDQRGAWALAWTGSSLLAYDGHAEDWINPAIPHAPGELPPYRFSPISIGTTQRPNSPGPNKDTLYDCSDASAAEKDEMPCFQTPGYFSAAPRSHHAGGVNAAYVDGHVDFVSDEIDEATMAYLISINDGHAGKN